jgi:replicative DNA helicase
MTTAADVKTPPHDLAAERSLLGAMLMRNESIADVAAIIDHKDFYRDAHRRIFEKILALAARSEAIDLVTLRSELALAGTLDEVGGPAYIASLVDGVPASNNAEDYAGIVRELADRRRVIAAARKLEVAAFDADRSTTEILDDAQGALVALTERQAAHGFVPIDVVLRDETMPSLDRAYAARTGITGVPTGFADLDHFLRGLQPGDLDLIGARSSTGKTSLATEMMRHIAVRCGRPVGLFSLEMSAGSIGSRLLIAQAQIDGHRLLGGVLPDSDWARVSSALSVLAAASIHIDATANITLAEMRARARRLRAEHGLSLLVLDYIQLMNGGTQRTETRNLELAAISRGLKALAKELEVPVVVLSQLNRATEARPGGRPQLADLRDCGALEQDADVVLLLHREELYKPSADNRGIVEVIIAKHRNGPTGSVRLRWIAREMRFEDLSPSDSPALPYAEASR